MGKSTGSSRVHKQGGHPFVLEDDARLNNPELGFGSSALRKLFKLVCVLNIFAFTGLVCSLATLSVDP